MGPVWLLEGSTGKDVRHLQEIPPGMDYGKLWRPVAWSPNGRLLVGLEPPLAGARLMIWNAQEGEEVSATSFEDSVNAIAWHPDGQQLAYAGNTKLWLWGIGSERPTHILDSDWPAISLAWSPDGKRLAAGCTDGKVLFWNRR
jgi:WD40 repeat protein